MVKMSASGMIVKKCGKERSIDYQLTNQRNQVPFIVNHKRQINRI